MDHTTRLWDLNTGKDLKMKLRQVPVALVAFVSPTTSVHWPSLEPALEALAAAYQHAGIGVGEVALELGDAVAPAGFGHVRAAHSRRAVLHFLSVHHVLIQPLTPRLAIILA